MNPIIEHLTGTDMTNVKLCNHFGNVAIQYTRLDHECIHVTTHTEEMEIESINQNLVTLKYKKVIHY